jgi:hypothetical protein
VVPLVDSRPHGLLVSTAAVRTEAEARRVAHAARVAAGPRELPDDDDAEYVLPSLAARRLGVPARWVHSWQTTGKVASRPSRHGRLVRLVDVQEMAARLQTQTQTQQALQQTPSAGEADEHTNAE